MNPLVPGDAAAAVCAALLAFYDASARALPWRGCGDAYRILVSEVMAQQTRLDSVIPYYERWLERFPDVGTLADSTEDDVLRHWAGLGYYSRARNLHAAARIIRERHAGAVPGSYDALRALPGIGDYTAGAVSSIAFGVPAPAVDGNARRVLCRLFDEPAPAPARLRELAAALMCTARPGDFNQALMELGSRVCTPRAPRCTPCPLHDHCAARAAGTQLERPARAARQVLPIIDMATAVLRRPSGRVLLVRRPRRGLLAGMWSFPAIALDGRTAREAAVLIAREEGLAVTDSAGDAFATIEHDFSHRRERYHCSIVAVTAPRRLRQDRAWVGADVDAFALPRAQQKIHALLFAAAGGDA
jgi:A/G-specific adenine glycosylase